MRPVSGQGRLAATLRHRLDRRVGIGSTLLGRNTGTVRDLGRMRGIDYLQSRPEVDPRRIGCTGNSGGGTQTSYMMALDDRIRAAAPSRYLCGFPAPLQDHRAPGSEQNLFGQPGVRHGPRRLYHERGPTPVLMCTATKDFFDIQGAWGDLPHAKRLYTRMGFAERVDLLENDAGHNYKIRSAGRRSLAGPLADGDYRPIAEPAIERLPRSEYQCTPAAR